MQAAELFIKCLEKEGVKYIFGLPGEENLLLLEAIRKSSIKFILTRHEQSAVFMAATVGRMTGKIGVALTTLGPGATNAVTGIAHAQLGGMPLLVITGQKPIYSNRQGRFQIIDVVRMLEPITKSSSTVLSGERIPSAIHEAVKVAEEERPGAVHLELPEDVAGDEVTASPFSTQKIRRPGPDPKAIATAVDMIQSAKHPLILVGAAANRKLVRKQLESLIHKTKIPFITTQMGKGVLDESSDYYLGTTALSSTDYIHCALDRADVVVVIGHDIYEKPPIALTSDLHQVIHINFYSAHVEDVYAPSYEVVGDISHTLWSIANIIKPQADWDFSYFITLRDHVRQHILESAESEQFPLKPQRLARELRQAMPRESVVALDNGMYKIWLARNFPALEQNTVLLDNALATMGAGLPAGIAAKIISPDKKVVVVTGDGGFMMSLAEVETAYRLQLDLVIIILSDSALGMIRWKQAELNLPDFGLSFTNPDFIKLAQSFNVQGYKIKTANEFLPTLQHALGLPGIQIIDCPIDYTENTKIFVEELKIKTCNI